VLQRDQNLQDCRMDEQCLLMPDACGNSTGVNKTKMKAFENHLAQIKVKCPALQSANHSFEAKCIEQQCAAVAKADVIVEKPDFYACKQDADCIIAAGVCSDLRAVNKVHLKAFEENTAFESQAVSCASPGLPPGPNDKVPTYTAKCTALRCEALLN
jgi:hypothetical protein